MVDTKWLYKGQHRSLLEAVCMGGVSGSRDGCDLPLRFWLACSFGKEWRTTMKTHVEFISYTMVLNDGKHSGLIDDAILWAFEEAYYDLFT